MSSSNLKRRKLRTFLTVLGVVIGTASIVVMISLGLGLQQSLYREIEQSGGITSITVTGKAAGESMFYYDDSEEESTKYVTDETIQELLKLEHVKSATPTLEMSSILLSGKYYGYIQLVGMTREELERQNMKLVEGSTLPQENAASLDLVIGNGIPTMFYEKATDKGYWDNKELPDIDFMNDQMFLVLDQQAYFDSLQSGMNTSADSGTEGGGTPVSKKPPKKHVVQASGMVAGGVEQYTAN